MSENTDIQKQTEKLAVESAGISLNLRFNR
jgi:hypothetical protein